MRPTVVRVVVIVLLAGGGFLIGRATAPAARAPVPRGGYLAGREDAFSGFDGGWSYRLPYIVTLRRGGPGITYAFARRWPLTAGREYRACRTQLVCSRPIR